MSTRWTQTACAERTAVAGCGHRGPRGGARPPPPEPGGCRRAACAVRLPRGPRHGARAAYGPHRADAARGPQRAADAAQGPQHKARAGLVMRRTAGRRTPAACAAASAAAAARAHLQHLPHRRFKGPRAPPARAARRRPARAPHPARPRLGRTAVAGGLGSGAAAWRPFSSAMQAKLPPGSRRLLSLPSPAFRVPDSAHLEAFSLATSVRVESCSTSGSSSPAHVRVFSGRCNRGAHQASYSNGLERPAAHCKPLWTIPVAFFGNSKMCYSRRPLYWTYKYLRKDIPDGSCT